MGFGDIFLNAWKTYKSNFWLYFKLVILFLFLPSIILYIVSQAFALYVNYDLASLTLFAFAAELPLGLLIWFIGILAYVGIFASAFFNKNKFKDALAKGKTFYWRYIGLTILIMVIVIAYAFFSIILIGVIVARRRSHSRVHNTFYSYSLEFLKDCILQGFIQNLNFSTFRIYNCSMRHT